MGFFDVLGDSFDEFLWKILGKYGDFFEDIAFVLKKQIFSQGKWQFT